METFTFIIALLVSAFSIYQQFLIRNLYTLAMQNFYAAAIQQEAIADNLQRLSGAVSRMDSPTMSDDFNTHNS